MLEAVGMFALLAVMTAFGVAAVLANEGEHAQRRARRKARRPAPGRSAAQAELLAPDAADASGEARSDRRLPVGNFIFGALYVMGDRPTPFPELAEAAGESGLNVSQVLAWLERAEESGLVERVPDSEDGDEGGAEDSEAQPAVRLTTAGMDIARNNRRSARKGARRRGFVPHR